MKTINDFKKISKYKEINRIMFFDEILYIELRNLKKIKGFKQRLKVFSEKNQKTIHLNSNYTYYKYNK